MRMCSMYCFMRGYGDALGVRGIDDTQVRATKAYSAGFTWGQKQYANTLKYANEAYPVGMGEETNEEAQPEI